MSRFFTERLNTLVPYVPGEQPQDRRYVKLNTNESPFPPSEAVSEAVLAESKRLQLYSDPDSKLLRREMAAQYGLPEDCIVMSNGSDETLNFAFMAFADEKAPLYFADITYGFYPVFAELNHIPYTEIPLREGFTLCAEDYLGLDGTVVLANPNAPTGRLLPLSDIERIVAANREHVVIVDEAYIDFGGESAAKLVPRYDNLLVIGTFSKSRSLAGARLGFAFGAPELMADLNTIRYSTNPYNVNRLTAAAGVAALQTQAYYDSCCRIIMENRTWTEEALTQRGFTVIPSAANFVFAKSGELGGEELYLRLKEKGVLIRHFNKDRIRDYNRITIGTREEMETLVEKIDELRKEKA